MDVQELLITVEWLEVSYQRQHKKRDKKQLSLCIHQEVIAPKTRSNTRNRKKCSFVFSVKSSYQMGSDIWLFDFIITKIKRC
jgi:hypothetical protein